MDTEKRFILALTLCMLILFVHASYINRYRKTGPASITSAESRTIEPAIPEQLAPLQPEKQPMDTRPKRSGIAEDLIEIDTGSYIATLSNIGAGIRQMALTRLNGDAIEPLPILNLPKEVPEALELEDVSGGGWVGPWRLIGTTNSAVTYEQETAERIVQKEFIFPNDSYNIELRLTIKNKSTSAIVPRYKLIGGHALLTGNQTDDSHTGADVKTAGKIYRKRPSDKSIRDGQIFNGTPEWASIRSRYSCVLLKPTQPEQAAFIESYDNTIAWSGLILSQTQLLPGESVTLNYVMYAGPNNQSALSALGVAPNEVLGYWLTSGVGRFLFSGVKLSKKMLGNYGVGIILLSFIVSFGLFPLTRKTLESAKKTQQLQPEIERIKKEYKDKPDKMNKEIMELYKKAGVNPLGGCLPLLLQLPIFLSLFQILPRSIELRGARFLWIKDLSETDAIWTLPTKFPVIGNNINLLPILMAITTVIQQKLSHPGGDVTEQQRMMSFVMPVMLCFIFYNMPSCIVLYWFVNTLTTLFAQEVILKSTNQTPS